MGRQYLLKLESVDQKWHVFCKERVHNQSFVTWSSTKGNLSRWYLWILGVRYFFITKIKTVSCFARWLVTQTPVKVLYELFAGLEIQQNNTRHCELQFPALPYCFGLLPPYLSNRKSGCRILHLETAHWISQHVRQAWSLALPQEVAMTWLWWRVVKPRWLLRWLIYSTLV